MARKLLSAVALAMMVVSATVLALGLGGITTHSALNQGFDAEVALLSVDPADLDTVRVRLASAEDFARAGVDRPFFLSELKFTPMLGLGGKPVIHISSEKPIREPFLNFLVEVNWPNGKLVREYTVLLDPPTTLNRRPAEVSRPQAAPRSMTAPASTAPRAAAMVMPDQYGPVQENETLWGIASKLRPDGVSLTQTMMALYKANQNAFSRGNINRLERGRILRVPGRDEMFALSRSEADAAYQAEQAAALASRSQASAEAAPDAAADAAQTGGDAAASTAAMPASTSSAELRIATPRPDGEGDAGSGDDNAAQTTAADLKNALLLAREESESSRQAAEVLRGQVDSMEQQLADMQRLLSLKDEQLAQLQSNVAQAGDQTTEAEASAVAPASDEAPAAADVSATEASMEAPAEPEAATATDEGSAANAPEEQAATEEQTPADATAVEGMVQEPQVETAAAVAEEPAPSEPEPMTEAEPAAEEPAGLLGMVKDNILLVGGAILALVILLVMLLRGRGKGDESTSDKAEETFEESILMEPSEGDDFDLSLDDAAPGGNDTSFLSEFSPSEMHSLADDTSEVDPVSEADVYIAYGRYDQAEDLLGQALKREPQRMALKYKLLEVYYANHNVPAFTACAQELADAGQDGVDADAWQRVCDMGRELSPDYPLFSAANSQLNEDSLPDFEPSEQVGIDTLSEFNEESILDVPKTDRGGASGDSVDVASEHVPETEMDLTLDLEDLSMPHSATQEDESFEGLESIELELPDLDVDPAKRSTRSDASDDSLILELDTGMDDARADETAQGSVDDLDAESLQAQLDELSDLTDLDDELSQLTAEFDGLSRPASALSPDSASEDLSELDIPAPFAGQMDEADEVQTKLDLAIAYVEMGDKEGARSILDEVRNEGSAEQQAKAEKLLAEISA